MLKPQARAREEVLDGLVENHAERADIDAIARRTADVEKLDLLWRENRETKVLGLVVDMSADGIDAQLLTDFGENVDKSVATFDIDVLVNIFAKNFQFINHGTKYL